MTASTAAGSHQRKRVGPLTYISVIGLLVGFAIFVVGIVGGSENVPATATVISGKAVVAAQTSVANEVQTCGQQDGTIMPKGLIWHAPPLEVTNVVVGPAMSAPGSTFHLLEACVVAWLQLHGAGQNVLLCPGQAAGSAGGDTVAFKVAFIRNLISCSAAGG